MLGFSPLAAVPLGDDTSGEDGNRVVNLVGVSATGESNTPVFISIDVLPTGVSTGSGVGSVATNEGTGVTVGFSGWNAGAWSSGSWGLTRSAPSAALGQVGSVSFITSSSIVLDGVFASGEVGDAESAVNISVSVGSLEAIGQLNSVVTTQSVVVDLANDGVSGTAQEGILHS